MDNTACGSQEFVPAVDAESLPMNSPITDPIPHKRKWSLHTGDGARSQRWWVIALFAAWAMYVGTSGVWTRLLTSVAGTIISSTTTQGVRPVTYYTIQGSDGKQHSFLAGPAHGSLPREMPVGTAIQKRKFELSYTRNGQKVHDFPLAFHLLWFGVSAVAAWMAFVWWRSDRNE